MSYLHSVAADGKVHYMMSMGKSPLAPNNDDHNTHNKVDGSCVSGADNWKFVSRVADKYSSNNSMIVLQLISNRSKRLKTFVGNKIATIDDGSSPSQWRHIYSGNNPADDASR